MTDFLYIYFEVIIVFIVAVSVSISMYYWVGKKEIGNSERDQQ
jgi:NADH:ubiquinone oxidoreductase subunit 3 (subunit A)